MYKLYKKVEKSDENGYGIIPIDEENPFEKPSFLSLLALNFRLRDTNGSISRILELAGVRTPEGEERISVDEIPINFLGLSYDDKENEFGKYSCFSSDDSTRKIDDKTRQFVIRYLLPLLIENGQKKNIDECRKNMRNINIMCYCDALFMVSSMNKVLVEEMTNLGFSQEEISDILSQVCIFPIGAEYYPMKSCLTNMRFTTICILDMSDSFGQRDEEELRTIFGDYKEGLFSAQTELEIPKDQINLDSRMIVVNDDGRHDLPSFIKKGIAFPSIIIKTINTILNNSVTNNNGQEFVPLSVVINQDLPQISSSLLEAEKKGISKNDLLSITLESISYPEQNIKKNGK